MLTFTSVRFCASQVPVGRETLGRIMNVIGEPVDECGPISEHPLPALSLPAGCIPSRSLTRSSDDAEHVMCRFASY